MTNEQIIKLYDQYDKHFRAEKKRGNYKKASEWKAKRDALSAAFTRAIKEEVHLK